MHGSFALVYDHSDARSLTATGIDLADVQAQITAGDPGLNPFGPLPMASPLLDRVRSIADHWSANLTLNAQPVHLPAGPLQVNLTSEYDRSVSKTSFNDAGAARSNDALDDTASTRMQIDLPVASRRSKVRSPLGELRLSLSGAVTAASGTRARTAAIAGLNWAPIDAIELNIRAGREENTPSSEQRNAPLIETPGVRVYDYATGQPADVVEVTGGNPDLLQGARSTLDIGGFLHLFGRRLAVNFDYQRRVDKSGVGSLPALTPIVEAAFPDRIERNSTGQLVRVDLRPINLARDTQSSLRGGISLTLPLGKPILPADSGTLTGRRRPEGRDPFGSKGSGGPGQTQVSLNNRRQLSNALLIREGSVLLDRLRGEGTEKAVTPGATRRWSRWEGRALASRCNAKLLPYARRGPRPERSGTSFRRSFIASVIANLDLGRASLLGRLASRHELHPHCR